MKKETFYVVLLFVSVFGIATSCSEESKFKEFAVDFAHAVNSGDTLKIDTLLAQTNSFQFSKIKLSKINIDSLTLTEASEGKYKVTSVGGVTIIVAKVGKKMVVEQTWNVFNNEPISVTFALKHNLIKKGDNDKVVYEALLSKDYAIAKTTEQEEQKFAQEKEAVQKVIVKTLASFAEVVNTLQGFYDMDPNSLWWSMNATVINEAEDNKRVLEKQKKYMSSEQLGKFKRLAKQYNRLTK